MATINISMVQKNPAIKIPEAVTATGISLMEKLVDLAVAIGKANNAFCKPVHAKRIKGTEVVNATFAVTKDGVGQMCVALNFW